jgi:uncharacterized delta-60 repeat protein
MLAHMPGLRRSLWLCAALVSLAFGTSVASASPGSLDPAFGAGGRVVGLDNGDLGMAALPADQVAVLGCVCDYLGSYGLSLHLLDRFGANRTITPDFRGGTAGTIFDHPPGVLASNPRGLMAVVTNRTLDNADFTSRDLAGIAMFGPNGSPDAGFANGSGHISVSIAPVRGFEDPQATLLAAALDSAGRPLLGIQPPDLPNGFRILRVTRQGAIDPSFDSNRAQVADARPGPLRIAVDGKDRIVATSGNRVWRFRSDGRLDPSFGPHGVVTTSFAGQIAAVSVAPDDGLVMAVDGIGSSALVALRHNGHVDRSFGGGQVVMTAPDGTADTLFGVTVQRDGRVVGVGADHGGLNAVVVRRLPSGAPDTSFAPAGRASFPPDAAHQGGIFLNDVVETSAGRLVAAGEQSVLEGHTYDATFALGLVGGH